MSKKLLMRLFVVLGIGSLLLFGCDQESYIDKTDVLKGTWHIVADVNYGDVEFKDFTVSFDENQYTLNNQTSNYKIKGNQVILDDLGEFEIKEEGQDSLRLYRQKDCYFQLIKGELKDVELTGLYHVNYRVSDEVIDEDVEFNDIFVDYRNNEVFMSSSYTNKDQLLTLTDLNKSFYTYQNDDTILLVETDSAFVWELVK